MTDTNMRSKFEEAKAEAWQRLSGLLRHGINAPYSPKFSQWFEAGYQAGAASVQGEQATSNENQVEQIAGLICRVLATSLDQSRVLQAAREIATRFPVLPQGEQEPVAWVNKRATGDIEWNSKFNLKNSAPLYAAPAQQVGSPLTDEILQRSLKQMPLPDYSQENYEQLAHCFNQYNVRTPAQPVPDTNEQFCDAHCVWTDHHPDCPLQAAIEPKLCAYPNCVCTSRNACNVKVAQPVPDTEIDTLRRDALRYLAIRTRHRYALIRLLVDPDGAGYSSHKAPAQIDAWADDAVKVISAYNALTPQQKMDDMQAEIDRLQVLVDADAAMQAKGEAT